MIPGQIKLSLGTLSLGIEFFTSSQIPRSRIEPLPKIEYSNAGTPIGDGSGFESRHIWAVSCLLTKEQNLLLLAIWAEFDNLRRQRLPSDILVEDTTSEFVERLPRTRAIAPNTVVVPIGTTHVAYFGVFKAWMTQPPEFEESGNLYIASFSLTETNKVPA